MRCRPSKLALTLALAALPPLALAQTAPAPAASSEAAPTPPAPPPPAPKVTVTPYGFALVQAFFSDGPFASRDYPGQVLTNGDNGAFLVSARGSRFGLKVGLPDDPWTGAKLGAVIEADFKGGSVPSSFATTCTNPAGGGNPTCTTTAAAPSTAWYNGLARLRLAYAQAAWTLPQGKLTLVAGQDWRVVAPLAPTSLAYGYDQLFTAAGNLNQRDPQLKVAYDVALGDVGVNVTAAVLSPQDTYLGAPAGGVDYGAGNRSRVPNFEGRVAGSYSAGGKKVAEVGVAGLVGKRRYITSSSPLDAADTTVKLAAVDALVVLPYVTVQGEGYVSDGTEDALTGMLSSAVLGPSATGSLLNLESRGGWVQAVVKPIPQVAIPVGYGVALLRYQDAGLGAGTRTRNAQFHAGLLLNASNPWKFGVEWVRTTTGYALATSTPQTIQADQLALATKLDF